MVIVIVHFYVNIDFSKPFSHKNDKNVTQIPLVFFSVEYFVPGGP